MAIFTQSLRIGLGSLGENWHTLPNPSCLTNVKTSRFISVRTWQCNVTVDADTEMKLSHNPVRDFTKICNMVKANWKQHWHKWVLLFKRTLILTWIFLVTNFFDHLINNINLNINNNNTWWGRCGSVGLRTAKVQGSTPKFMILVTHNVRCETWLGYRPIITWVIHRDIK